MEQESVDHRGHEGAGNVVEKFRTAVMENAQCGGKGNPRAGEAQCQFSEDNGCQGNEYPQCHADGCGKGGKTDVQPQICQKEPIQKDIQHCHGNVHPHAEIGFAADAQIVVNGEQGHDGRHEIKEDPCVVPCHFRQSGIFDQKGDKSWCRKKSHKGEQDTNAQYHAESRGK